MNIKTIVKQSILRTIDIAGVNAFYRRKNRRRLLALCYHSVISDDAPADDMRTNIAVTVSQFEEQLKELRKHYQPVSLQQIYSAIGTEFAGGGGGNK
ncbi:MAG: hypothetical protein LBU65_14860, partial [Planctomycetaceae bacterium]|nr:hypothetical protein [Planctomycetaceae bacterium]